MHRPGGDESALVARTAHGNADRGGGCELLQKEAEEPCEEEQEKRKAARASAAISMIV